MTSPIERYPDILSGQDDAKAVRLVSDLDALCAVITPPPYLRGAIAQALQEHAAQRTRPRRPLLWRRSLVAVLLLIAGGMAGYLHVQSPSPVSAQAILQRAASGPAISPDSVVHQVWTSLSYQMISGRPVMVDRQHVEVWTQVDRHGHAIREASMLTGSASDAQRTLRTGAIVQQYNPHTTSLTILTPAPTICAVGSPEKRQAQTVPMLLDRSFLRTAPRIRTQTLRLLPPQMLGGVAVNVVDVSTALVTLAPGKEPVQYHQRVRLYIDARTFVIRGEDIARIPTHGLAQLEVSLRIMRYEVLPLSAAARVFQLRVPATAHIIRNLLPPQPCLLTVAEAVALPHQPSIILSGHPSGLHLARIDMGATAGLTPNACVAPAPTLLPVVPAVAYYYQTWGESALGPRVFCVVTTLNPMPSLTPPPLVTQALTLPIAGQRMQARYVQIQTASVGEIATHLLWYYVGGKVVALTGTAMTKREFFIIVRSLVKGQGHPTTAASLQRDLDTAHPAL